MLGNISLDTETYRVKKGIKEINLTKKEFALLELLLLELRESYSLTEEISPDDRFDPITVPSIKLLLT